MSPKHFRKVKIFEKERDRLDNTEFFRKGILIGYHTDQNGDCCGIVETDNGEVEIVFIRLIRFTKPLVKISLLERIVKILWY